MFSKIAVELTVPHEHAAHVRRSLNELIDYLTLRRTLILDSHVTTTLVSSSSTADWESILADEEQHRVMLERTEVCSDRASAKVTSTSN